MATDLDTQIRDYAGFFASKSDPVTLDEIEAVLGGEGGQAVAAPRRNRRPGVWVAAAAAVVTLLLVGLLPFVIDNDDVSPADTDSMLDVVWTQATWTSTISGPGFPLEAAPWGFVGGDDQRRLWTSPDAMSWSLDISLSQLQLDGIVDGGTYVLVQGWIDGSSSVFRSSDGQQWNELDLSLVGVPESRLTIGAALPSGMIVLHDGQTDLVGFADDQRILEVYPAPWQSWPGGPARTLELRELGEEILAFQKANPDVEGGGGRAWQYLGDGLWTDPVDIPVRSQYVMFDGRLYGFDQRQGVCCGNELTGVTQWQLMASSDGFEWTTVQTVEMEVTCSVTLRGGGAFLVYGQGGCGGPGIVTYPGDVLWTSVNAEAWQPIDISFAPDASVRIFGDTILITDGGDPHWIGQVTHP